MANLIFVAGLDNRQGDLNLAQQTDLLKKGYDSTGNIATISSFRYNATDKEILNAIDANLGVPIVLFSAGCAKSKTIANHLKSKGQSLTLLHINEPYTVSTGTKATVEAAIELGVPRSNVYSGGSDATGNNIVGNTRLKDRKNHFQSLTPLGKLISEGISNQNQNPPTPTGSTPSVTTTESTTQPQGTTVSNIGTTTGNVKIKLVKKSGPGELMGEVEKEVNGGQVEFGGLQFDQAGDYVISAVPSSSEIETKDFNISVLGPPEEPQAPKAVEEPPADGSRPIIAQIDKPTYFLKPIEFDTTKNQTQDGDYSKNLGFTPFFWYMGYQINDRDISTMTLYNDGLVPKVQITFADSQGIMKKEGFPLDNTKFEIFINSGSSNLKFVHLRFKLENFQNNKKGRYTITGTLDLKDFYKPSYKSYTGTSFEVLRTIAKELELGYNSNINNTTDSQKWTNTGKLPKEFINDIVSHSYISDEAFLMGYIDFNYCFNYVDLEKEWRRDITKDVGIVSRGVQSSLVDQPNGDEDKITTLKLTNDQSQQASNLYISNYKLNNASTKQSITKGQFSITKFYDTFSKSFLVFDIDSLTSDGEKTVILKGTPTDTKELETNYRTQYQGRVDLENVHQNYLYAKIQNKTNFDNLARITVELELPNPNFNLYRFMKIDITFVNQKVSPTAEEIVQTRISGEWMVLEIVYSWSGGKLSQKLVCARKELGKLPEEIKNQATTKEPETNVERNENPATASVPNSAYLVGEIYTVQDKNGSQYKLTITNIDPNGIDVRATVLQLSTGPTASGLTPSGLTPSGLTPSGLTPSGLTPSGLTPSGPTPSETNTTSSTNDPLTSELKKGDLYYLVLPSEVRSEIDRSIRGTITFRDIFENQTFDDPIKKTIAVGNLIGFLDGGKLGPVQSTPFTSFTNEESDKIIRAMELEITNKYSLVVNLKTSDYPLVKE